MTTEDALDFFARRAARQPRLPGVRPPTGVRLLAETLGINVKAVYQWGERVPELRARQLHEITRGRLKFDPDAYRVNA